MNIGENIKQARKKKGYTQKQLAEKCNMYESQIRKYELGNANPKIETLQKIANALDINVLVLLEKISIKFSDDIRNDVSLESAFAAFFKEIYGKIDLEQQFDENGRYFYYTLGEGNETYTISELTYDNIFESVENLIKLSVNIATKHSESQEFFNLIYAIKDMDLETLKQLTSYAEYLNFIKNNKD